MVYSNEDINVYIGTVFKKISKCILKNLEEIVANDK